MGWVISLNFVIVSVVVYWLYDPYYELSKKTLRDTNTLTRNYSNMKNRPSLYKVYLK